MIVNPHVTDSLLASTSGVGAAVAAVSIDPPQSQEGMIAYMPALFAGIVAPFLAMAWRSALVIYQSRRAKKKALLEAEAEQKLGDQDPANDSEGKAAKLEAELLDAEIKAIDKLIDKVN